MIQGSIYNRLIFKAVSELYKNFAREVQPLENARILDVGSGPGFLTLLFAQENPTMSVVGVDYSPTQVRAANHLRIRHQIHNCSFRQGNAMNLPFQEASFDIVISVASIKHWLDGRRGLQGIRRVLIPNGSAFIAEADREATDREIYRFASKFTPLEGPFSQGEDEDFLNEWFRCDLKPHRNPVRNFQFLNWANLLTGFTAWYVSDRFMKWFHRRVVFGQSYTRKEADCLARAAGINNILVEKVVGWHFFIMKLRK